MDKLPSIFGSVLPELLVIVLCLFVQKWKFYSRRRREAPKMSPGCNCPPGKEPCKSVRSHRRSWPGTTSQKSSLYYCPARLPPLIWLLSIFSWMWLLVFHPSLHPSFLPFLSPSTHSYTIHHSLISAHTHSLIPVYTQQSLK